MSKKTKIVLIVLTSVAVVVNIVLIATGNNSMSQVIQDTSGKFPVIPFAVGVLAGHFFWRVKDVEK